MRDPAGLERSFYHLFEAFFHKAERNRRWNLMDDIPWAEAGSAPNPEIVQLVESFCAVELYLPDYLRHLLGMVRRSRGRAWFQANWGYEEMKHSLALERWLVCSGARTEDEIHAFADDVLTREWTLHYGDAPLLSLCYTVLQELATGTAYRRLKAAATERSALDPALEGVLTLLHRDEVAHFAFFKDVLKVWMEHDRTHALESLGHVLATFHMPASDLIPDWEARDQLIRSAGVMNNRIFLRHVILPVFQTLGVTRDEIRALRTPGDVGGEVSPQTPSAL